MSEWGERPTPGTKREKPCNLARLSPDPRADRYASSIQRRFRTNLSVDCRPRQAGLTIARLYLRPRLQFEFDRETRQCDAHRSPPLFRFDSLRFGSVRFDSDRFGSTRIGSVRFGRSSRRSRWIVPLFFRVSLCGKIGGNFPWKGKDPGRRGRGAWQGEESDARSSLHRSSLLKPGVNRERKREREIGCEAWGSWIESSFESFFRFLSSCPCLFSCGEAGEGVLQGLASSRRQVILVFLFFLLPSLLLLFL